MMEKTTLNDSTIVPGMGVPPTGNPVSVTALVSVLTRRSGIYTGTQNQLLKYAESDATSRF